MLNPASLDELASFDTPTLCNALECFDVLPRTEGFMDSSIRRIIPRGSGRMVGYAVTARIRATQAPRTRHRGLPAAYYEALAAAPSPRVTVIEDLDPRPVGSFWGEVQVNIHVAIGCRGLVTNGGVRDLDEIATFDFDCFAAAVLVSHAYAHLEEIGGPVRVGGVTVRPGDLVHADKHGVAVIPAEVAPELAEACRAMQYAEAPVIEVCARHRDGGVDLRELAKARTEMEERRRSAYARFGKRGST